MTRCVILITLGLLLSACSSPPPVQFYVLEPINQSAAPPIAANKPFSIGVGPVSIPALLERKKIVTRTSDNTVQISEFQQWATPLEDNLLHTLTSNLAILQPNNVVRAYPWSVHGTVDIQVIIDITRFDTTPGKSVNLEANWTIKNEKSLEVLKNGHSTLKHPLSDSSYPVTVTALSKILGEFSRELSSTLLNVKLPK
jgi:uncharacterized protein